MFSEAWLHQHQMKMASFAAKPKAGPVIIELSQPFKLLNALLRMHWRARSSYSADLSQQIADAAALRSMAPALEKAAVRIERYSVQAPDTDNLWGGAKPVVDCLLARSNRHPWGLGFITDDDPAHLALDVVAFKSNRASQRTVIIIQGARP